VGIEVVRIGADGAKFIGDLLGDDAVVKVFHHATFDLGFLQARLGVRARNAVCTKVAAKLLWPGDRSAQRLTGLTKRYLGFELDKTQQLSDWSASTLTHEQLAYAAADVEHLPRLFDEILRELDRRGLLALANACWEHLPVRAELEFRGYGDVFTY
jgi:ribonuclease D